MKNIVHYLLCVLAYGSVYSQEGQTWKWSHEKPQGNQLTWVKIWDSNNWYAVGVAGTFMKTTNAGASWSITHRAGYPNSSFGTNVLNTAYFWNVNNGVAAGTAGITYTTNAGATWDTASGPPTAVTWNDMTYVNDSVGFAAGTTSGRFAKTTNRGRTWTPYANLPTLPTGTYYGIFAFDENRVFIVGSQASSFNVRRSTDGGLTWTGSSAGTGTIYAVKFVNDTLGFVAGASGYSAMTTNGGVNWTQMTTGVPTATTLRSIYLRPLGTVNGPNSNGRSSLTPLDLEGGQYVATHDQYGAAGDLVESGEDRLMQNPGLQNPAETSVPRDKPALVDYEIYLVGDSYNMYKSTDYGTSWTAFPFLAPVSEQPWTSTYYSTTSFGNRFVTVGAFGLINTSADNGSTWSTLTHFRKAGTLNDVWAESGTGRVWAVGAPGIAGQIFDQIAYSSNAGAIWSFQSTVNSNVTLNCISMVSGNVGYVAGTNGRVRKTTNGGASWDSVTTPITAALNAVSAVSADVAWVFGATGNVWITTNAGVNWNQQTSGVTGTINDAEMVDANTGWFVGASGVVRKTTNGGTNWDPQTTDLGTSAVNGISMISDVAGYLASTTGRVRKTTNGGASWDVVTTPVTATLNAIHAADADNVMCVAATGLTIRTSNGGLTWTIENAGGTSLNAVYMVNKDTAYAVGLNAQVFRYAVSPSVGVAYTPELPVGYELLQNYPNPFNPATIIEFALPKAAIVSVKVYDVTGRELAVLVDNLPANSGRFKVPFDASKFASGVYMYSLIVDNALFDTKKMMLVK